MNKKSNKELIDNLKRNPVKESVTLDIDGKDILIEDRSKGKVIQIWINDVPHIASTQPEFRLYQGWKMSTHASRFCGQAVMILQKEESNPMLYVEDYEWDNPDIGRAVATMLVKYK